jgi:voltage-gated sodium channel
LVLHRHALAVEPAHNNERIDTVRQRLASIVNGSTFQNAILVLIFLNGVVLAVDAMPGVPEGAHRALQVTDRIIVWVFIVEILLRIWVNGRSFFRDGWSLFDLFVVALSAPGTMTAVSSLRILRALRLLRVLSGVPRLRKVGEALLLAVPGISWVGVILLVLTLVAAIIGTGLFGEAVPEYFGDLFVSMYTLFTVITLENWPDVADPVLAVYPWAWIYFVVFIMVATFTMLNLVIGVIISVMDRETSDYYEVEKEYRASLRADMDALKEQMGILLARLDQLAGEGGTSSRGRGKRGG